jgi:hypothetical protein
MNAFQLQASLVSPIVVGQRSPNLAGLLYHCCFLHTSCEDEAETLLATLLKETDGVYHASDMVFGVDIHQNLIATTYSTVGVMNTTTDLIPEHIKPNGRAGKYSKIVVEGGPTKARLNHHQAYFAKSVNFYGFGDVEKIQKLLNFYVSTLGLFSNGKVSTWQYSILEKDQSFYLDDPLKNQLLINRIPSHSRLLQHEFTDTHIVSLKPPFYKKREDCECVMPERILKTLDM